MRLPEMTARQQEIFSYCERYFFDHENPAQVIKNAQFFREGYDAYGLSEAQLKELRDTLLEAFVPTMQETADLARIFFASGKYEFGSLAFMLLKKQRPHFDRYVYDAVREITDKYMENWAHCDLFSQKITPVFLELGIASMEDFAGWRDAQSRWTRRCGIVTMLYLRDKASPEMLLDFAIPMLGEQEKVAQQGMGTFLREMWKLHSAEVEDFLAAHKEEIPRVVMQYAIEKVARENRRRFHRQSPEKKGFKARGGDRRPKAPQAEATQPNAKKGGNRHVHTRANNNAKPRFQKPAPPKKQRFKPNTADPEPLPEDNDDFGDWDTFTLKDL